jgi:hypothetical protein
MKGISAVKHGHSHSHKATCVHGVAHMHRLSKLLIQLPNFRELLHDVSMGVEIRFTVCRHSRESCQDGAVAFSLTNVENQSAKISLFGCMEAVRPKILEKSTWSLMCLYLSQWSLMCLYLSHDNPCVVLKCAHIAPHTRTCIKTTSHASPSCERVFHRYTYFRELKS